MIRRLHSLVPEPATLIRMAVLQAALGVLQGLLLGLLVPILRALLRSGPDLAAAAPWLVTGAAGFVLYAWLSAVATPVGFAASGDTIAQVRRHLMAHLTTLPLGWFSADRKARFARTVTSVAGSLGRVCVVVGGPALNALATAVTITAVMFVVEWRLALVLLVTIPAALLAMRRYRRATVGVVADIEVAGNEIAGRAIEYGQAQPVLRAAGQGGIGTERMRAALAEHRRRYAHGLNRLLPPDLACTGVVLAGFAATLLLGAHLLVAGTLSVPDTVAMLVLAVRFLEPIGALGGQAAGLGALDYMIGTVRRFLATPALPAREHPVRELAGTDIEFTEVGFAYGDTPALAGVSFRCAPGTTTALVGPSGSGKSTVTKLVARFFDAGSGSVRVGGVDVRDYDHATLLSEIAIVFQDVYLFDTTIEENLRIARPDATRAELQAVADAARLTEVIDRLPGGWATDVGEAGAQLSGGERQRVSIARALLKQARIVLIDEPSSALDPENEAAVSRAIAALAEDPHRTVIVIAHRPAGLASADHVVTLDAGRVVQTGPPERLLATGGPFADLVRQYEHAHSWRISTGPR